MAKKNNKNKPVEEIKSHGRLLYEQGQSYNHRMKPDYYEMVRRNERMTYGDQWEGVISKGLPTPQINILKRVLTYFVAFLTSSPLKINYTAMNVSETSEDEEDKVKLAAVEKLNTIASSKWEDGKMDELLREAITDAGVTGDSAAYTYWDSSIDTGNEVKGDFVTELVDGVNVIFGNPNDRRVNANGKMIQPWLMLVGRQMVSTLKEEAKANGLLDELSKIGPDSEYEYQAGERGDIELEDANEMTGKALYFIKFYPVTNKDGETTVHWCKYTRAATIREETDLKMPICPVAWMNWEKRKNSYHGQALMTNVIPNQLYVNKQVALIMVHQMTLAFGKVIYDKTKIANWNNAVGSGIGFDGKDGTSASDVAKMLQGQDLPSNIVNVVEMVMRVTLESLGANDVLLGDVKPENTSAIIQVTEQASVPLLNQKTALYNFVEQIAEIWYNYVKYYYGDVERTISYQDENGKQEVAKFKPNELLDTIIRPKIDVGPSNWWSENDQVKTLDLLYDRNILDVIQYLERMPKDRIPDKDKLIEDLKSRMGGMMPGVDEQGLLTEPGGMPVQEEQGPEPTLEQMEQFLKLLPEDLQQQLQSGTDAQFEDAIIELMNNPELLQKMGL